MSYVPVPEEPRDAFASLASVMDGMLCVECYGWNIMDGILPDDAQQMRNLY